MTNLQASAAWFEDTAHEMRNQMCKGDRNKMERRELKALTDFLGQCPLDLMIHDSNEIFRSVTR